MKLWWSTLSSQLSAARAARKHWKQQMTFPCSKVFSPPCHIIFAANPVSWTSSQVCVCVYVCARAPVNRLVVVATGSCQYAPFMMWGVQGKGRKKPLWKPQAETKCCAEKQELVLSQECYKPEVIPDDKHFRSADNMLGMVCHLNSGAISQYLF